MCPSAAHIQLHHVTTALKYRVGAVWFDPTGDPVVLRQGRGKVAKSPRHLKAFIESVQAFSATPDCN
jgi:hypothetical protein